MKYSIPILLLGSAILIVSNSESTAESRQPKEAGRVSWIRDYEKGRQLASTADKPMLLLFQEIPG